MIPQDFRLRACSSFTLVEMLTAIAVLALLIVLITQMTNSASSISDLSERHADASGEAAQVLDRIGNDVAAMLLRSDVDVIFNKQTGNDGFYLYSQTPGYFDSSVSSTAQSPVALIGYRITSSDPASPGPVLQRLAYGLSWSGNGAAMAFLTFPAPTSVTNTATANSASTIAGQWSSLVGTAPEYTNSSSSYYHTIGDQIFRFEIYFQRKNGSYSPTFDTLTNNIALVVAIATLDAKSRKTVSNFNGLVNALPDPLASDLTNSPTPILLEQRWNDAIQQPSFAQTAGIPASAAAQVRVYQRSYYLNTPYAP